MTALEKYEVENKIDEKEFDHVMSNVFHSLTFHSSYTRVTLLDKKDEMLDQFAQLLETFIDLKFSTPKIQKLNIINFIDKVNMQRELLEVKRNEITVSQLRTASKRFGKKAQSSV